MDKGAWWATVHAITKSRTRLSNFTWLGLEKETATHSHILAWEILWTEDPVGPQSMELERVRHDLVIEHEPV